MSYTNDHLFYEPKGARSGGSPFLTERLLNVSGVSFGGRFHFRREGIRFTTSFNSDVHRDIGRFDAKDKQDYDWERDFLTARRFKVGYRQDDWKNGNKMAEKDGEPMWSGVYRMSPERDARISSDLEKSDHSNFPYLEFAQFAIPKDENEKMLKDISIGGAAFYCIAVRNKIDFVPCGFHGSSGARIDKIGLVLENHSCIEVTAS